MRKKASALIVLFAMSSMLLFSAGSATAQPTVSLDPIPITGEATNSLGQIVEFAGTFDVTRVVRQGGGLAVVGTLSGTLTNTVTGVTQTVNQVVTLPITGTQATCEILDLTLGPLDLDLLGLLVHLDTVHLVIEAEPGPGNLLGNLLCAIAGLLDGPATPLNALVRLLNQLIGLLG